MDTPPGVVIDINARDDQTGHHLFTFRVWSNGKVDLLVNPTACGGSGTHDITRFLPLIEVSRNLPKSA